MFPLLTVVPTTLLATTAVIAMALLMALAHGAIAFARLAIEAFKRFAGRTRSLLNLNGFARLHGCGSGGFDLDRRGCWALCLSMLTRTATTRARGTGGRFADRSGGGWYVDLCDGGGRLSSRSGAGLCRASWAAAGR